MRITIIIIAVVLTTGVANVQAEIVWDSGHHEFSEGFEGEVWLLNDASADITGGYIGNLLCYDISSVDVFEGGDIDFFKPLDTSLVNIHGGTVNILAARNSSDTYIYDGSVNIIDAMGESTITLYVGTYDWDPTGGQFQDGLLTGTWLSGGVGFSIELLGPETIGHIHFVPEPSSITLIVIGSIIFRSLSRKT